MPAPPSKPKKKKTQEVSTAFLRHRRIDQNPDRRMPVATIPDGCRSSDRRSHGLKPGPQCAFETSMFCYLQFTLIHAVGCVLHRSTSRVIHRSELFFFVSSFNQREVRFPGLILREGVTSGATVRSVRRSIRTAPYTGARTGYMREKGKSRVTSLFTHTHTHTPRLIHGQIRIPLEGTRDQGWHTTLSKGEGQPPSPAPYEDGSTATAVIRSKKTRASAPLWL